MGVFKRRGSDVPAGQPSGDDPRGGDRRQGDRRGSGERRQNDRRGTIDLTRPRYAERRARGGSRRRDEVDQVTAEIEALPSADPQVPTAVPDVDDVPKTIEELEQQFQGLHAAMDKRLRLMKDLPEDQFEAIQARDEELVTAWAVALRRLEGQIAEARRAAAG
jgi:ElaB/YqjD/DUF883 family membrane-anchored ribosome-binding protein